MMGDPKPLKSRNVFARFRSAEGECNRCGHWGRKLHLGEVRRKPAEGFSRWNRTRTPPEKSRSTQCERDHRTSAYLLTMVANLAERCLGFPLLKSRLKLCRSCTKVRFSIDNKSSAKSPSIYLS